MKKKLFTIDDLERAWRDGFDKTHPNWNEFKVSLILEKVYEPLNDTIKKLEIDPEKVIKSDPEYRKQI